VDGPRSGEPGARATFGDVFGVAEYRALWLAQLLSVAGDQLARVALTVLVYDRTRSALLAAVTFAASVVPAFVGGVTLAGLADRLPRRQIMIATALASGVLVTIMALPAMPLVALVGLLFAVTMLGALFLAARAAIFPDILIGDRYVLGVAVNLTTNGFAQIVGYAVGGVLVGFLGVRTSLLADAATFGVSALIIRARVSARPVVRAERAVRAGQQRENPSAAALELQGHPRPGPAADATFGLRLCFASPALRVPMLFGWLCAFYDTPDGLASPLAKALGGGAVTVGLILSAPALGATVGAIGFSRLVDPPIRVRWMGPLAIAAPAVLVFFAVRPSIQGALVILAGGGVFACYQLAANASFVQAAPSAQRSLVFGIAQGGMSLGQGAAMILAGAAAQYVAPTLVIAAAGCLGVLCAVPLALSKSARPQN
jgi:MFS family permease